MVNLKSKFISFFANLGLKFMNEDFKISYMILSCKPSVISNIVIIPVVDMIIQKFKNHLKNLKTHGKTFKGNYNDIIVSIVPTTVGAPAAAILMEALNCTKAEYIFKIDFCGGLTSDIRIGDIIIANNAICADGTTPHYEINEKIITGDKELLNELKQFFDVNKIDYIVGPIYTTDGFFKETEELLNKARNLGAIAIDMESSVIYLLGKLFNKKVLSINIVSDIPDPEKKFDLNINSRMIDNMDILVKRILDFISEKL